MVLSVIPNNRHPFLLPSVSGKDEIAIAIASPVFLTCAAWLSEVQSIFGWYFQCLNEMKFDIHNQSTVVKQSNKDNKGHVSWILYVRKRLGTFFSWMVNRR